VRKLYVEMTDREYAEFSKKKQNEAQAAAMLLHLAENLAGAFIDEEHPAAPGATYKLLHQDKLDAALSMAINIMQQNPTTKPAKRGNK